MFSMVDKTGSLTDEEAEEIWERVKQDVDVDKLKAENKTDFVSKLEKKMRSVDKNKKQVRNLINIGFAERVSKLPKMQDLFKTKELGHPIFIEKPVVSFDGIAKRKKGIIYIKTKKKTRRFKETSILIKESTFRGKPAIYFSNKKTGKRISWGLLNE